MIYLAVNERYITRADFFVDAAFFKFEQLNAACAAAVGVVREARERVRHHSRRLSVGPTRRA